MIWNRIRNVANVLRIVLGTAGGIGMLVTVVVFLVAWLSWECGAFQSAELSAYDFMVRHKAPVQPADSRIVVVAVTEEDIRKRGYPIPDVTLAALLERIEAGRPRAIGVDIYRDIPVPRDGSGQIALRNTVTRFPNIVWIFSYGDGPHGIRPPAFLENQTNSLGFNNYAFGDEVVRRGILFLDDGADSVEGNTWFAMPTQLARYYLAPKGIDVNDEPPPSHFSRIGATALRRFSPNNGAYIKADARGYQYMLDFAGPRRFTTYTLDDVLSGRVPRDFGYRKVVLIGTTAVSVKDAVRTPLRPDENGVYLHAQTVNQLLRTALQGDTPVQPMKERWKPVWLLAWCIGGCVAAVSVKGAWRFVAILAGTASILGAAVATLFAMGYWAPFVAPLFGLGFTAGIVTGFIAAREQRFNAAVMDLFKRNLSDDVAKLFLDRRDEFMEAGRLRSQKLTATVLFTDMVDFTSTAEDLDSTELLEWVNSYLEQFATQVEKFGGTVVRYMGDSLMAVFGAPIPRKTEREISQDAVNAIRCALEMERALLRFNVARNASGKAPMQMRIGIHTGTLASGCIGSARRLEFTVLGDTVNTASRLESIRSEELGLARSSGQCRILIGDACYRRVTGIFEAEEFPNIRLKGKSTLVTIHRILGEMDVPPSPESNTR